MRWKAIMAIKRVILQSKYSLINILLRACRIITEKENGSTFALIFIMSIKVPKNVLIFTGLGLRLIKFHSRMSIIF